MHRDFADHASVEGQVRGYDACSASACPPPAMAEADHRRVTYDFTLAAATALARVSPAMTFV